MEAKTASLQLTLRIPTKPPYAVVDRKSQKGPLPRLEAAATPLKIPVMARYRHYKNLGGPGDTVFITTTCLDFAHVLRRPEMKDRMVSLIYEAHRRYKVTLHAYAVMSNHFHLVSRMSDFHGSDWFMQRLKEKATKTLLPLMTPEERDLMCAQVGLDHRECWQRSFDSVRIVSDKLLYQKIGYTHRNPLVARLVDSIDDYRWSSAALYTQGLWSPETGLPLDQPL